MTRNPQCLVIGDTHFNNSYPGYLEAQLKSCFDMVNKIKPKYVVFLGDIYHHRKPSPEVIVGVDRMFRKLSLIPGVTKMFILRGNHDSANRSDDGLTVLTTLEGNGAKINIIDQTELEEDLNFLFIPHYENEDTILESMTYAKDRDTIVFGHFGFEGCMNSTGFFDFELKKEDFKHRTILGHIHAYSRHTNITVLGTPWSTNFGEVDQTHYVGLLTMSDNGLWGDLKLKTPSYSPRHYVATEESLEPMGEDIADPNFFTVLRVIVSNFTEQNYSDLKAECKEKYAAKHVDIKFQPILDKKLSKRLSGYNPNTPIANIDDDIVNKYIEEQSTAIPIEDLKEGLDIIKRYEDNET
tara:strand:+ start:11078 stop:12136 length:1059 start_codon:yes stop_codon:yes gene_type:complete